MKGGLPLGGETVRTGRVILTKRIVISCTIQLHLGLGWIFNSDCITVCTKARIEYEF